MTTQLTLLALPSPAPTQTAKARSTPTRVEAVPFGHFSGAVQLQRSLGDFDGQTPHEVARELAIEHGLGWYDATQKLKADIRAGLYRSSVVELRGCFIPLLVKVGP